MANTQNGITVNHLPSLTWNRLRVNSAFVDLASLPETQGEAVQIQANTEEVLTRQEPASAASAWADTFSGGIRREAYIAGKRAIYQEQVFATGLGREFTDLIDSTVPYTDIYTVEAGQKLEKPVVLRWEFADGTRAAAQQIIHAREGAEAVFLIVQESDRQAAGHAMFETKLILEKGAKVNLIKVNLLGDGFVLLDDTAAVQGEDTGFTLTQMLLGGGRTYAGCYADLSGDRSSFVTNTGYLGYGARLLDINYVAVQRGRKTESRMYLNGALKDESQKVFRGTIDLRKGSKGSVGDEQEDVLLLDPKVVNKQVPVILTEEEDVNGRHGATIGNLADDMMFYLGTRGIGKYEAEMLMTRGRLMSIAQTIPDEETIGKIYFRIKGIFEKDE
ncbi:MAG: SufD family Fe-S cluster assembly protein [Clostridia bacterium]|nr:SufD family Fe-S cluster assembly protein [Clostridia bacterium]